MAQIKRQSVDLGDFVSRGEELAAQALEKQLPDRWWVVCNREIWTGAHVREIDFIVVAEKVIYVLDEKSWSGAIYGDDSAWVLPSGESMRSPINKVNARAREVAGYLRKRLSSAFDDKFVYGKVLLSADQVQLRVNDPRNASEVLRLKTCGSCLKTNHSALQAADFPTHQRNDIINRLCDLNIRPRVPRKIREYTITQDMKGADYALHLKASHDDGSEWLLKVVGKPLTVDTERFDEQKELLLREYNCLRKLESTRRAPRATPYFCWNNDEYWIVPTTLPSGESLEASGQRKRPDARVAWRVLDASFEALSEIHANQVIHRAITPDRVFLSEELRVSFGGFVISRVGGRPTISASARNLEGETEFTSQECRQSIAYATGKSDVYSLAASLLAWCGMDLRYPEKVDALPGELERVAEFLLDCMCDAEERRPTAKEALKRLREAASVHCE